MCFQAYSLFTVCGHHDHVDTEECETYSKLGTWNRLTKGCEFNRKAVKFIFGWCLGCTSRFFEDDTVDPRGGKATITHDHRDTMAVRRYWEYKRKSVLRKCICSSDAIRSAVNPDGEETADAAKQAASTSPDDGFLNYCRTALRGSPKDLEFTYCDSCPDELTHEEEALKSVLLHLKPSSVKLGPRVFDYPFFSKEECALVLHKARFMTIIWANGDDELYQSDAGIPRHWDMPYAPKIWSVTRDKGVAAAEAAAHSKALAALRRKK
ncbi:hypothetical protein ACHAQJ_010595 [Trichoderma viride]